MKNRGYTPFEYEPNENRPLGEDVSNTDSLRGV